MVPMAPVRLAVTREILFPSLLRELLSAPGRPPRHPAGARPGRSAVGKSWHRSRSVMGGGIPGDDRADPPPPLVSKGPPRAVAGREGMSNLSEAPARSIGRWPSPPACTHEHEGLRPSIRGHRRLCYHGAAARNGVRLGPSGPGGRFVEKAVMSCGTPCGTDCSCGSRSPRSSAGACCCSTPGWACCGRASP